MAVFVLCNCFYIRYGLGWDISVGLWLYANNYWERSAYVSNSTNFMNVNNNGNPSNNNNASNTNGVLCGFSGSEVALRKVLNQLLKG